jgi:hypothetical protein
VYEREMMAIVYAGKVKTLFDASPFCKLNFDRTTVIE